MSTKVEIQTFFKWKGLPISHNGCSWNYFYWPRAKGVGWDWGQRSQKEKHLEHLIRIQSLGFVQNKEEKICEEGATLPLRTNWEHFILNTSHGPGLVCPSTVKKKKADEWEENRIKKEERWQTSNFTSSCFFFFISKVSYLFWNPNLHQSASKKQLISH